MSSEGRVLDAASAADRPWDRRCTSGCFQTLGILFAAVLVIRALLFDYSVREARLGSTSGP